MSYGTEIVKVEQPASAELYTLKTGSTITDTLTSYDIPITYQTRVYTPAPIKRSGFSIERSLKTIDVRIAAPVTRVFQNYLSIAPFRPTTVEIRRVFLSDPDALNQLIFTGIIDAVSVSKGTATALCRSANKRLSRKIPRMFYQTTCNHVIFDAGCKLNKNSYMRPCIVLDISANDLTLSNLGGVSSGAYVGGSVEFGLEERLITTQTANVVTLLVQFSNLSIGDTVKLYPGCIGTIQMCAGFGNLANFFGMPYIPTKNAILWGFR